MNFELYYVNKKPAAQGLAGWDGAEEKDGE
jgi:hypothetical protein